jgi:protein O-GlcNAc transferase
MTSSMAKSLSSGKKSAALRQLLGRAVSLHQNGYLADAEQLYLQILRSKPVLPEAQHLLGVLRGQQGRFDEALTLVGSALKAQPNSPVILSDHGLILLKLRRHEQALVAFEQALAIQPNHPASLSNRGNVLSEMARWGEALASYDQALKIRPDYPEALYNRGNALSALRRYDEAVASYGKALAFQPRHADSRYRRGNMLVQLKRWAEAIADFDAALAINPNSIDALHNRGNALFQLKRFDEALASHDRALAIRSDHALLHDSRGNVLLALKRFDEALASFERALELDPRSAPAFNNCGNALKALGQYEEALRYYEKALAIRPDFVEALNNRGGVLIALRRFREALASFDEARAIDPDNDDTFGGSALAALAACDWRRTSAIAGQLASRIATGRPSITPFALLGYCDDPALQFRCAVDWTNSTIPAAPKLWEGARRRHDKIRIAYLSADFRRHPMAHLIAELFELHDRSRFEIAGVSFGYDDGSEIRSRIAGAFDRFYDVQTRSDREIAELLHATEVDIAIDLMGHTKRSRPEVLSFRPAPIQVSYLGYPGTTGAPFIDYLIADKIVVLPEHEPFLTEKIVRLPDCYWVNDRQLRIAAPGPTRQEVGLPAEGFVFCCFNNAYKITPPVFDIWMRLLQRLPASVLWLLRTDSAMDNLRREAHARGVDPARLVFADRASHSEHLARQRLADLFLDTQPVNAHTTATDALWAGLPVLTCQGQTFAARVASSLLTAVGLPELVTTSLEDYEALALRLSTDAALLQAIRAKLARNRDTYPLFDTDRFCRHLESAFSQMWEIQQRGELPHGFSVESIRK